MSKQVRSTRACRVLDISPGRTNRSESQEDMPGSNTARFPRAKSPGTTSARRRREAWRKRFRQMVLLTLEATGAQKKELALEKDLTPFIVWRKRFGAGASRKVPTSPPHQLAHRPADRTEEKIGGMCRCVTETKPVPSSLHGFWALVVIPAGFTLVMRAIPLRRDGLKSDRMGFH